ncbi:rhomboid family intramembrane serine protease [Mesobacillus zeae]|uniref:Rhomboid family intramembrane serine protease n=1 Tax=Mesobacillus zeae TaxID=1917180 RepID=A0A398B2H8_9BACI|nr:rhomboid family intramembrane serine protease [Mesobacillus zeae]RID83851.1 rhomboid family intramembrane serine protease [Mesobacillus zeae]
MNYLEEYRLWSTAHFLIADAGYELGDVVEDGQELLLVNPENRGAQMVRLVLSDLNWANQLRREIEFMLDNAKKLKRELGAKDLKILNVYYTQYSPVDDFEELLAQSRNGMDIDTIIVDSETGITALAKIRQRFGAKQEYVEQESYSEDEVRAMIDLTLSEAGKKAKKNLAPEQGKPWVSYLLIAISVLVFLAMTAAGGSTDTQNLIEFGAKFNPLILDGEWWRFFAPIFIHIGLLHLFMNSLALYYLGPVVEQIYGHARFLFIYIFAGFAGVLASFLYSPNLSAGASGAIWGCFGALLYFGVNNKRIFFKTMGSSILTILAINLAFSLTVPGIDISAHLGGLAGGFAASAVAHFPGNQKRLQQFAVLAALALSVSGLLYYGFSQNYALVDEKSMLMFAQEKIQKEEYRSAEQALSEYTVDEGESADTLFLLSFAEIRLGKIEEAKEHLHSALESNPDFHEASYNLALVYMEEKNYRKAKDYAEKAVALKPDNKDYMEILNTINDYLESPASG